MARKDCPVVVLCGGKGSRMAPLTQHIPKCLIQVEAKPLLWFVLHHFKSNGFRHFILPLGYLGHKVQHWLEGSDEFVDCQFDFIDTGVDASLTDRLESILPKLADAQDFFLCNSDTISEFDLQSAYQHHLRGKQAVTLMSMPVASAFGLILKAQGQVVSFMRDVEIESVNISNESEPLLGYLNSGFALISTQELARAMPSLKSEKEDNFEQIFYGNMAELGKVDAIAMNQFWKAFDSKKDLDSARNTKVKSQIRSIIEKYEQPLLIVRDAVNSN